MCYAVIFLYTLLNCSVTFVDEKIQGINKPIEEDEPPEEIRHEPYSLPSGFVWDTLDLIDPLIVQQSFSLHLKNILIVVAPPRHKKYIPLCSLYVPHNHQKK